MSLSKHDGAFDLVLLQFHMIPAKELPGIVEFGQTVSYLKR